MNPLRSVANVIGRRRMERELAEEMDLHVEEKIEELVRQGLSRPAAAHAARRAFGNVTRVREESQDVWRWRAAHDVAGDLRYDPELATSADVTRAIALVVITGIVVAAAAVLVADQTVPALMRG